PRIRSATQEGRFRMREGVRCDGRYGGVGGGPMVSVGVALSVAEPLARLLALTEAVALSVSPVARRELAMIVVVALSCVAPDVEFAVILAVAAPESVPWAEVRELAVSVATAASTALAVCKDDADVETVALSVPVALSEAGKGVSMSSLNLKCMTLPDG